MSATPSLKEFFRERVDQNTYGEVKRDRTRRGCGVCRWCLANHPLGCPHTADQSQIDAVMASIVE